MKLLDANFTADQMIDRAAARRQLLALAKLAAQPGGAETIERGVSKARAQMGERCGWALLGGQKWLELAAEGAADEWETFAWRLGNPHLGGAWAENLQAAAKAALPHKAKLEALGNYATFWEVPSGGAVTVKSGYDYRTAKPYKLVWYGGSLIFNGWPSR